MGPHARLATASERIRGGRGDEEMLEDVLLRVSASATVSGARVRKNSLRGRPPVLDPRGAKQRLLRVASATPLGVQES
jgi:hypothetical protein